MRRKHGSLTGIGAAVFLGAALLFTGIAGTFVQSSEAKELSLSTWIPIKLSPEQLVWKQMGKDLEEATGGEFKIKIYDAQILGKAREHYELVVKGIADIAYLNVGFTPGRFPVTDMVSYAFAPSGEIYTRGMIALWHKGLMDKEYDKVKLLSVWSGAPSNFLWRKGVAPATTLADFKGKKIRVPTTGAADLVEALGGSPVAIPMPEVYTALERGVVDGVLTTLNTLTVFHLSDLVQDVTKVDALTFGFSLIMNMDSWKKLPEAARSMWDKKAEEYSVESGKAHDKWDEEAVARWKPKFHQLPPPEQKNLMELQAPSFDEYVKKYESAGYSAKDAAQVFHQTLKDAHGVEPFQLSP